MKKLKMEMNFISWFSLILIVGYLIIYHQNLLDGFFYAFRDLISL